MRETALISWYLLYTVTYCTDFSITWAWRCTDKGKRFLGVLTEEVHHEAIVVAVNVGGRVRLELDGDVSCRGVELETRPRATVLAQYLSSQVVSIIECQQVIHSHVEAAGRQNTYLANLTFSPAQ